MVGIAIYSEAEVATIRTTFEQQGELPAAVASRRLFPGLTDGMQARECRAIAGWKPPAPCPPKTAARQGAPGALKQRDPRDAFGDGNGGPDRDR